MAVNRVNIRQIKVQPRSPLLRLPGELRNRIYDYLFADLTDTSQVLGMVPLDYRSSHAPCHVSIKDKNGKPWIVKQIQFVCRQLRFETLAFTIARQTKLMLPSLTGSEYYPGPGCTPWYCRYYSVKACVDFLTTASQTHLQRLRRIDVRVDQAGHQALTWGLRHGCGDLEPQRGANREPSYLEVLRRVRRRYPQLKVVVSAYEDGLEDTGKESTRYLIGGTAV